MVWDAIRELLHRPGEVGGAPVAGWALRSPVEQTQGRCGRTAFLQSRKKHRMKRRQAIVHLASAAAAVGVPRLGFAQGQRLVLGQSAALTGPSAQLGMQMNLGARLHFEHLNAGGGINGRTVDLRALDDGYEPERCKANTETLLKDGVLALFGYVGTPTCLAAWPQVIDSKVPFFGPFTGAQALRDPLRRNVFHVRASYFDETALIVKHLTSLGLKKIAVFYQDDSYGNAGLEGVRRALQPLGLEPVAAATVARNSVDVARAVKTIIARAPDAVVQVSAYKSCAAFIRESRKAGYGGSYFNVSFVGTQALADELGRDGRGIIVSQVMPFPFSTTSAIAREYLDAVKRAGGNHSANYSSMEGYVAAKVLAEGIRRAGRAPTHESLISGLESMQNVDFGGFNVNFGPNEHVASKFVEIAMITEDGKVRR